MANKELQTIILRPGRVRCELCAFGLRGICPEDENGLLCVQVGGHYEKVNIKISKQDGKEKQTAMLEL